MSKTNSEESPCLLDMRGREIKPGKIAQIVDEGSIGIVISITSKEYERHPVAIFFGDGAPSSEDYLKDPKKFEKQVAFFAHNKIKILIKEEVAASTTAA